MQLYVFYAPAHIILCKDLHEGGTKDETYIIMCLRAPCLLRQTWRMNEASALYHKNFTT